MTLVLSPYIIFCEGFFLFEEKNIFILDFIKWILNGYMDVKRN